MTTRNEILRILTSHLDELRSEYGVQRVGLFGSYQRGEQTPASDIDLLVELSRPTGLIQFIRLERHLEQLLGHKVDLVSRKALKPHIGQQILQEVRYAGEA